MCRHNKYYMLGYLLLMLGFPILFFEMRDITKPTTEVKTYYLMENSDIIKTVAHINVEEDKNLEKLFEDKENDIVYYRFLGNRDLVHVGDTVYLDGYTGTVTETDIKGFNFSPDFEAVTGMSGHGILDKEGNQVGYISSLSVSGDIRCIWT